MTLQELENDTTEGWSEDSIPSDAGMATAEYAVVTIAAAGFAGVLAALLKSSEVRGMLMGLIESALSGG